MSIWGPGPFENDDGADWIADLRDEPSLESIREAFAEIADPAHVGYVEVPDGAEAVAAAEVLAELLGSPGDDPVLDEDLDELAAALNKELKRESKRDVKTLVKQALDALEIVLNDTENSELRQMWDEQAEEMPAWTAAMTRLQQRLRKLAFP
ncbi:MAG: DUF4259 domain-containing protein [Lamprocystis purpurea]|jgi:hypothetical protein|uniref:DUF4259 domain-containing protein n=1 Tax=Lamprocystis purpurea TaxID=61598 RepID=UPI00036015B7|nr:DUF4259 domain-containing protein [Lamprocystis purpurea]MBV5273233.1 DUF4259 domain-containing protein [Lamprocystis purpurea]